MNSQSATIVQDALIPNKVQNCNGCHWIDFRYSENDLDPWRWPEVLKYQDRLYKWSAFNSDKGEIYYKEISPNEIATVHTVGRGRRRQVRG